jgi:hypothetical protein
MKVIFQAYKGITAYTEHIPKARAAPGWGNCNSEKNGRQVGEA